MTCAYVVRVKEGDKFYYGVKTRNEDAEVISPPENRCLIKSYEDACALFDKIAANKKFKKLRLIKLTSKV